MFFLAWGVRVIFWENMFSTTNYLGMQMVGLGISMWIWFEMLLEIVIGTLWTIMGTNWWDQREHLKDQ